MKLIDGKTVAEVIRGEIKFEIAKLKKMGITPKLKVLLAGDDPASLVYAKAKKKSCANLGIDFELVAKPGSVSLEEVLQLVKAWNSDRCIHGMMIELPLPENIDKNMLLEAIDPKKDVDGVTAVNRGYLMNGKPGLYPVTPQSCIEILLRHGIGISGKNVVLVGRGETIGKPLIFMLLNQNATVTVCHTKTKDLAYHTRQADILIAAAGREKMITREMVKEGAVVLDAGINPAENGGICGDVDFTSVAQVAGAISPVPGGIGSLTTVLVQKNLLTAIKLQGII